LKQKGGMNAIKERGGGGGGPGLRPEDTPRSGMAFQAKKFGRKGNSIGLADFHLQQAPLTS